MVEGSRLPALAALGNRIASFGWPLLVLVSLARAVIDGTSGLTPIDYIAFEDAGRILLSSGWADAFSSSFIQIGPLNLAVHGALALLSDATGVDSRLMFAVVVEVGLTAATVATFRAVARVVARPPAWIELVVGLVVAVAGPGWIAYISGHPADPFIALAWLWAARFAREGRARPAGLLLALATGIKQWGLLGVPILLLAGDRRRVVAGLLVQACATALLYGPFFLFGDVNTFEKEWTVASLSLPRLFLAPHSFFPWWMRLAQGAFVLLVGVGAALALKNRADAVWLVPLLIVVTRLASEPFAHYYHWLAVDLIALIGVATLVPRLVIRDAVILAVGCYGTMLALYFPSQVGLLYRLIFLSLLSLVAVRVARSSTIPLPATS